MEETGIMVKIKCLVDALEAGAYKEAPKELKTVCFAREFSKSPAESSLMRLRGGDVVGRVTLHHVNQNGRRLSVLMDDAGEAVGLRNTQRSWDQETDVETVSYVPTPGPFQDRTPQQINKDRVPMPPMSMWTAISVLQAELHVNAALKRPRRFDEVVSADDVMRAATAAVVRKMAGID